MRQIGFLQTGKSKPWSSFNGTSEGNSGSSFAGSVLYISEFHSFSYSRQFGYNTNNMAEIKAVLKLVEIAVQNGIQEVQIFGDSQLVVGWVMDQRMNLNLGLRHLIRRVKEHLSGMVRFSCCHIFKDLNKIVDGLSKHAANALVGLPEITKTRDNEQDALSARQIFV
jgi:ribonuclease HI